MSRRRDLCSGDRPLAVAVLFSLTVHLGLLLVGSARPLVSRARSVPFVEVRLLRQLPEATESMEAGDRGTRRETAGEDMAHRGRPEISSSVPMRPQPAPAPVSGGEGPGEAATVPDRAGESLRAVEISARAGGPRGGGSAAASLRAAPEPAGAGPQGTEGARPSLSARAAGTRAGRAGGSAGRSARLRAPDPSPPGISPTALDMIRRRIDEKKRYPLLARKNGWEGEVVVEIRSGGEGTLQEVRLLRESGYPVLDRATLEAARRAAPYPPFEGRVAIPVAYRLKEH